MNIIMVEPNKSPYIKKIDDTCMNVSKCFASIFGTSYDSVDAGGQTIDLWPNIDDAEESAVSDNIPFCVFNPKAKEQGQPFNRTVMETDIYGKFFMVAYDSAKSGNNSSDIQFGVKNFNEPQMLYLMKKYDKA